MTEARVEHWWASLMGRPCEPVRLVTHPDGRRYIGTTAGRYAVQVFDGDDRTIRLVRPLEAAPEISPLDQEPST